jgi:DNA topoisomerase-1
VLGKHPDDGQSVSLYAGKYGPYVKHGKVNATIPDEDAIATLTLDEALGILAAKSKSKPKPKSKAKAKTAKTAKARSPRTKKAA